MDGQGNGNLPATTSPPPPSPPPPATGDDRRAPGAGEHEREPSREDGESWPADGKSQWTLWHTISLVAIIVAIGVVSQTQPPRPAFLGTLSLMVAFTCITGHGVVGLWRGVLIDERNRMSSTRLQMALWTIVVLAGFLTAALANLARGAPDPLAIAIPQELWMVMGISTLTLVGSPLILSTKKTEVTPRTAVGAMVQAAQTTELERTKEDLARQGVPPDAVGAQGKVIVWKSPNDARPADLFQGEERGNAAHLDLGKVQMFFFTLILVFTYVAALTRFFSLQAGLIASLPALDQSMVALLGISHAGYLANKAAPHSTP